MSTTSKHILTACAAVYLALVLLGHVGTLAPATGQRLVAVVLYESADVPKWKPAQAAALRSLKIDKALSAKGCPDVQRVDVNGIKDKTGNVPPRFKPFLAKAQGKPLPWMIVASQSGRVLYNGVFAADEAAEAKILGMSL